ncbi:MAG: DNA cytosine methyltransferase, partial [Promethearchaeota archaeon]
RPRDGIANAIVCGGMGKERNLVIDKKISNSWQKEGDNIQLRNNEGIRKMTPREWARLQGFPESFVFPVSKTRQYRQLGNSVAVPVIKAIAEQIKKSLDNNVIIKKSNVKILESIEGFELLMKLYEKRAIPKTGKKYINSIETFIEKNYLRIEHLKNTLKFLEERRILYFTGKSQIKLSSDILNLKNIEAFREKIENLIYNAETSPIREKYIKNGIISAGTKY